VEIDWDVDDEGKMALPILTGFAIALLPDAVLAVQLRGTGAAVGVGFLSQSLQIGMTPEAARELGAALLKAADMTKDTLGVGRLN
jgi:hypothetical protein